MSPGDAGLWVITSFIYHESGSSRKHTGAVLDVTFPRGCSILKVVNLGVILVLMIGIIAVAYPDVGKLAALAYITVLITRRL